jgi:hypothetical protein
MQIVAGTFSTPEAARTALHDLEKQGISPANMNVIQADDKKGFDREHRSNRAAAFRGACAGALFGLVVIGALLGIAGANFASLRVLALYLCAVAICKLGGALIFALWNMGTSHDEALLYEEARDKNTVIAAVEVAEGLEEQVLLELVVHGASDVRAGKFPPEGWTHAHPSYDMAV